MLKQETETYLSGHVFSTIQMMSQQSVSGALQIGSDVQHQILKLARREHIRDHHPNFTSNIMRILMN